MKKDGQLDSGRDFNGRWKIHTNLRGLKKSALSIEEGNHLEWVSSYGSISFNQFGMEFPNAGINEKGLVVELMWLNDSKYPAKDARPSIRNLQVYPIPIRQRCNDRRSNCFR